MKQVVPRIKMIMLGDENVGFIIIMLVPRIKSLKSWQEYIIPEQVLSFFAFQL